MTYLTASHVPCYNGSMDTTTPKEPNMDEAAALRLAKGNHALAQQILAEAANAEEAGPLAALRHHVTGAIDRGEAEVIVERPRVLGPDEELVIAGLPVEADITNDEGEQ